MAPAPRPPAERYCRLRHAAAADCGGLRGPQPEGGAGRTRTREHRLQPGRHVSRVCPQWCVLWPSWRSARCEATGSDARRPAQKHSRWRRHHFR